MQNEQNDTESTEKSAFPQARLDEMMALARNFDPRRPPSIDTVRWDFRDHYDDNEAIYMASMLQVIRQGLYEIRYPELKARRLIPFDTNLNPGMERYVVRTLDVAGETDVSRDQPDDVPTIELKTGEADNTFFSMVLSYAYSDQDVRAAMMAGMPLQAMKAKAVRDQFARMLDTLAFLGHVKAGTKGLLNQASGTTTYTVPATGTGGSKLWSTKDADQVLLD